MKQETYSRNRLAASLRSLKITTQLAVHPDFLPEPRKFARRTGLDLVGEVYPETHFRKDPDNPGADEKLEKMKWNVHLVRHQAIRLLLEPDNAGCPEIRSIELEPPMLLHEMKRCWLSPGDLLRSLSILREQVSLLLADPQDARHIVPGLSWDEPPKAFWSMIDSEILLEGIQIPCLHNLGHPNTGPAAGAKNDRIQLGDKGDECVIRFKTEKWRSAGPGSMDVQGIRARLMLRGSILASGFSRLGRTTLIDDMERVVSFSEVGVACVHQAMMSKLEGTCLPVPPEWRLAGKNAHARTIAWVSSLYPIPPEDLLAMDKEIRQPSPSTRTRLRRGIKVEESRLHPFPVAELFSPAAYASLQSDSPMPLNGYIDPEIATVYG